MPKSSKTSKQARNTGALTSPKDHNTAQTGQSGSAQLAHIEGVQADPQWIAKDTMHKNAWRAALTGTVALMALIVITALGGPKLLSSQQDAPSANVAPPPPSPTHISATPTRPSRSTPANAVLPTVDPSATLHIAAVLTMTGTAIRTPALPTPTLTVAAYTSTTTASPAPATMTVSTTPTTIPSTATSTSTATARVTPTQILPSPTPTRTVTAIKPSPTRPRTTVTPLPTRTQPRPIPTRTRPVVTPTPTRIRTQITPSPARETTYLVQPGDTLLTIAAHFGVTINALAAANGLDPGAAVYPGQTLILPR